MIGDTNGFGIYIGNLKPYFTYSIKRYRSYRHPSEFGYYVIEHIDVSCEADYQQYLIDLRKGNVIV